MTHESDSSEKSETAVESFNLGRSRRGERLASVKKKKVLKKQTKTKETRSCLISCLFNESLADWAETCQLSGAPARKPRKRLL